MTLARAVYISRPIMWIPMIMAYMVGIGHYTNLFAFLPIAELLLLTFPLNFYLYAVNDYYDRETDLLNPRKSEGVQGGVISVEEKEIIKRVSWIPALISILISMLSFNLTHIMLMTTLVIMCFLYSAKYLRFKGIPILDGIASTIIYLLPIVIALTTYRNLGEFSWTYLLLALPACGAHAISTLTDLKPDKEAGIKTTGVVLGEFYTLVYVLMTFVLPAIFWAHNVFVLSLLSYGILITIGRLVSIKSNDGASLLSAIVYSSLTGIAMIYSILYSNLM